LRNQNNSSYPGLSGVLSLRLVSAMFAGMFLVTTSACSLTSRFSAAPPPTPEPSWLRDSLPREYVLETGDVCDVKLFPQVELNEAELTVRTDGKISVQLVGDIEARGRTPSQLATALIEHYTRAGLRQPQVTIFLRKSAGLRVYVGGEVQGPAMIPHDGHLTLSRAIIQAGDLRSTAEPSSVVIIRNPPQEKGSAPLFAVVDYRKLLEGGQDPLLQPYDIVFVPKSTIATLNQFVDQYFVKLVPVTLNAGFSYSIGRFKDETALNR